MTHTSVLDLASRLVDFFQPRDRGLSDGLLPRRFLIGGALLGLGIALPVALSALNTGSWQGALLTAVFALSLLVLLAMLRAGVGLSVLRGLTIGSLGSYFVTYALLSRELQWANLKWLSILPMVALFLADSRPRGGTFTRPVGIPLGSTLLAVCLAAMVVVASRAGWNAGIEAPAPGFATDADGLLNSAMFTASVSGLMWIHQLALRRSEEELSMLRSMLSVCAWCRRVRDDDAGWVSPEHYMAKHSPAQLTHGICPECERKTLDDAGYGNATPLR